MNEAHIASPQRGDYPRLMSNFLRVTQLTLRKKTMTDHITIPAVMPRIQYTANGSQTVYAYPFPIFSTNDLTISFDNVVQYAGYIITGAGASSGGAVTFAPAPPNNVIVTLERRLAIQRSTDFQEGGDFSARSLNNEFDYTVAALQQVQSDTAGMLRFDRSELPNTVTLPSRALRANKILGFDGSGNPKSYDAGAAPSPAQFAPTGTGAMSRAVADRLNEIVSVKDFGAIGNGIADDTLPIQKALNAHANVFVPPGTFRTTAPLMVGQGQQLYGAGFSSIIHGADNTFNLIQMTADYARVSCLKLENGNAGIKLFGFNGVCVQNSVADVSIWDANYGLLLDGYNDTNYPCYWNNFHRVLIARPKIHGVWLTKSGAGDTPNANKFHAVRVYSLGANITGSGFYVEYGRYNNSFVDCEANIHTTGHSCFRLGANTEKTLFINPYAEALAALPNFYLGAGSVETNIINLLSAAAGPAIQDLSGGNYTTLNSGYPIKNRLSKTLATDLTVQQLRYDTKFIDGVSTLNVDLTTSCYLVSAFGGNVTVNLPNAATAGGASVTIKKTDLSGNNVIIQETGGDGPDNRTVVLGSRYDYVTLVCNGATWWITSATQNPANTYFYDGLSLVQPDLSRQVYLVSAYSGVTECRLPPANAANAAGRIVTIKKTDVSTNKVNVSVSGGGYIDGASFFTLNVIYDAVTVISNGANWFVISKKS